MLIMDWIIGGIIVFVMVVYIRNEMRDAIEYPEDVEDEDFEKWINDND
jgi:hypothetical protein